MNRRPPPTVFVNGLAKEVLPRLDYGQVVALAFGRDDGRDYTVTWRYDGPEVSDKFKVNRGGTFGRSNVVLGVLDGMVIEVTEPAA